MDTNNKKQELEIRILAGTHAGATLSVKDNVSIGSSLECDIALSDPGITDKHLIIAINDRSWVKHDILTGKEKTFKFGEIDWLGAAAYTIDNENSSWPENIELNIEKNTETLDKPSDPIKKDVDVKEPAKPLVKKKKNKPIVKESNNIPYAYIIAGMSLVAFLMLSYTYVNWRKHVNNEHLNQKNIKNIKTLNKLNSIIHNQLNIKEITAKYTSKGVLINGWVKDSYTYNKLIQYNYPNNINPILRIWISSDITNESNTIIKKLSNNIKAKYTGFGEISLIGYSNISTLASIVEKLKNNVPGIQSVNTTNVMLPSGIAEDIRSILLARNIDQITVTSSSSAINISGSIEHDNLKAWEEVFKSIKNKYESNIDIKAFIVSNNNYKSSHRSKINSSIFGIYGIVGDKDKYIITNDGSRVTVGGKIYGFIVKEINDDFIVLDGPHKLIIKI